MLEQFCDRSILNLVLLVFSDIILGIFYRPIFKPGIVIGYFR